MITSMSRNELYKTLLGHYRTQYEFTNGTVIEHTIGENKVNTDPVIDEENSVNLKNLPVYADLSEIPKRDRFEFSGVSFQSIAQMVGDKELFAPYEFEDAIDFMGIDVQVELQSGYVNGIVDKERIARYYGDMAKRLDEAYAEGKFTEDEYKELSEMIEKQVEKEAELTERKKAFLELGKKRGSLSPAAAKSVILWEQSLTPEERFAERQQMINDYAEKHCKIDRVSLMQLFNKIRYGK